MGKDVILNPLTGEGFELISQNELDDVEHSGVKGMKWYQHKFGRWQSHSEYANGQPDPNAERREKTKEEAEKKAAKIKAEREKSEAKQQKQEARQAKAEERKSKREKRKAEAEKARKQKYLEDPNLLYKHRKEFTKEEIDEAMKTFKWEQDLQNYGIKRIENAKNLVGSIVDVTSKGIDGYNIFARIYNTFSKGDSRMPYIESVDAGKNKKNQKKTEAEKDKDALRTALANERAKKIAAREDEEARAKRDAKLQKQIDDMINTQTGDKMLATMRAKNQANREDELERNKLGLSIPDPNEKKKDKKK